MDVVDFLLNLVGGIIMVPFDMFLVYYIVKRHKLLFTPYFVTLTLISVCGTLYMIFTAYLDLQEVLLLRLIYSYFQYFIPLLSVIASLNRFSAIVLWAFYDRIWTWKRLCIYIAIISLVGMIFLLVIHIGILNVCCSYVFGANLRHFDRVFKATAYMIAFTFEVAAVIYRVNSKKSGEIDKVDITLLFQSIISTACWLINCGCNIASAIKFRFFLIVISDAMVLCGFVLPLVYLFASNRKLKVLLFDFYFNNCIVGQKVFGRIVRLPSIEDGKLPSMTQAKRSSLTESTHC
uniref:Serpentine receptor class gamma n=1 Tax=Panagrellus redivivus TaxID=6233 RepID=A0A7E4VTZ5_PANRE